MYLNPGNEGLAGDLGECSQTGYMLRSLVL